MTVSFTLTNDYFYILRFGVVNRPFDALERFSDTFEKRTDARGKRKKSSQSIKGHVAHL
jgi:hypothetical protein